MKKIVKNLLLSSVFSLTNIPYPFWPMKGIYCEETDRYILHKQSNEIKNNLDLKNFSICNLCSSDQIVIQSFPSRNRQGMFSEDLNLYKSRVLNFLNCDLKYDIAFFENENLKKMNLEDYNSFQYRHKKLFLNEDGTMKYKQMNPVKINYQYEENGSIENGLVEKYSVDYGDVELTYNDKDKPVNMKFNYQPDTEYCLLYREMSINFSKSMRSKSGVKIENVISENGEAKVILERDHKQIDLNIALKKYFNKDSIKEDFAKAYYIQKTKLDHVHHPKEWSSKYLEPILNGLNNPSLNPIDLEYLNSSTILAVWCLLPGVARIKDGQEDNENNYRIVERQILGLAKDKNGKLFHWTTNLGKDISVLMQYAKDSPKKDLKENEEPINKKLKID